jgi:hypothetical protein
MGGGLTLTLVSLNLLLLPPFNITKIFNIRTDIKFNLLIKGNKSYHGVVVSSYNKKTRIDNQQRSYHNKLERLSNIKGFLYKK